METIDIDLNLDEKTVKAKKKVNRASSAGAFCKRLGECLQDNRVKEGDQEMQDKLDEINNSDDESLGCIKKFLNIVFLTVGITLFVSIVVVIIYTSIVDTDQDGFKIEDIWGDFANTDDEEINAAMKDVFAVTNETEGLNSGDKDYLPFDDVYHIVTDPPVYDAGLVKEDEPYYNGDIIPGDLGNEETARAGSPGQREKLKRPVPITSPSVVEDDYDADYENYEEYSVVSDKEESKDVELDRDLGKNEKDNMYLSEDNPEYRDEHVSGNKEEESARDKIVGKNEFPSKNDDIENAAVEYDVTEPHYEYDFDYGSYDGNKNYGEYKDKDNDKQRKTNKKDQENKDKENLDGNSNKNAEDTITGYDDKKYDDNGYDDNGYDDNGYDDNGYDDNGYDDNGYDDNGYDDNRYEDNGYDDNGNRNTRHDDNDDTKYDDDDTKGNKENNNKKNTGDDKKENTGKEDSYYSYYDDSDYSYNDEYSNDSPAQRIRTASHSGRKNANSPHSRRHGKRSPLRNSTTRVEKALSKLSKNYHKIGANFLYYNGKGMATDKPDIIKKIRHYRRFWPNKSLAQQ